MPHTGGTPKIILSPAPRTVEEIFRPADLERLKRLGELVIHEGMTVNEDLFEQSFVPAEIVIGQLDLPESRLRRMPGLKAIFNVEGNFLPNVDYQYCSSHGTRVLSIGPVFAEPVAELALGLAIDLLRGITPSHCGFTNGVEKYELAANREGFSLFNQPVGFVGFGDLAKALLPLLSPFRCCLLAFDPWLPKEIIEQAGCKACSLDELLSRCRVIFVVASATSENERLLVRRTAICSNATRLRSHIAK